MFLSQRDERTHDSGNRNADTGHGSNRHELPKPPANDDAREPKRPYVDPAEEAMSHNPNLSPPLVLHSG